MRRAVFFLGLGLASALSCARGAQDTSGSAPAQPAPRAPVQVSFAKEPLRLDGVIPKAPDGMMAPSLGHATLAKGSSVADVDGCASCHTDVASQWRKSAHAFASFNNPVYRTGVDRIRKDRGERTSHFCGGCHDVSLLVDGSMLRPIEGSDLRAHAGITCMTCHSIEGARPDGNGSWDIEASAVPLPVEGDPQSSVRHRERVGRPALRTAEMCSTCHKAFLDPDTGNAAHLVGQDDATPWARSAYAGSHGARIDDVTLERDCRGCHMPRVKAGQGDPGAKNGTIASHGFLGGHTWLASMQSDPELVRRAQDFLQRRVSLDVGGVRHEGGRRELVSAKPVVLALGEEAVVDIVLRNLDVGHRFPGGVMDAQDTWIEIVVEDAKGARIASAGTEHETTGADPSAHTLSAYMANGEGTRLLVRETHEFRASVWNHTLPPRDAAVVGYSFTTPVDPAAYPLAVSARLRHRSRGLELQKVACSDFRSERGKTFNRVGLTKVARAIDACRPQPVTDVASVRVLLSGGAADVAARPDESNAAAFERRYAYGLGLSHALQEHLDDARAPLEAAIELARSPRDRAIAIGGLALVASRQGRTEETFVLADRADAAAGEAGLSQGPHPAMQRARAEVLASTWRLLEAAPLFLDVAERSPKDDAAWAQAAMTLGGAGDPAGALEIARRGLAIQPRDGDMLRAQALALASLQGSEPLLGAAQAAFLERRTPDDAPGVRGKCSAKVPGCANERVPVHVHAMRQAK